MRLKNRLYVTLLLISLVPLFLCGFIMLYQNNKNMEDVIEENLLGISAYQIDDIENFLEHIKQDMEIVANYSFLRQEVLACQESYNTAETSAREHIEEILKTQTECQPYIEAMIVTDKNFSIVASSEAYEAGANSGIGIANPKFLEGGFSVGNVYSMETEEGKVRLFHVYLGIYQQEELIGYLAAEVRADYFDKYHEGNIFWENGIMVIRDGNGTIVTCGGVGEENADFEKELELHDQKIESARIKRGYKTDGAVQYKTGGHQYIAQYANIQYTDWTIRVSADMDAHTTVGISYGVLLMAIFAVGFLMMQAMNHYINKKTVKPMEEIRELLKQVQQTGDYSLRLEPGTDDEVGELQHEVNHLLQCVMELQMQEKEEQKSLERKAEKDPMTGIMNKRAIADRAEQMAAELESRNSHIAVGFLDIDDFRDYNTKYGHAEGDHVIKFVAHTLREMIPGSVGRNGGDEFVFCMETDAREIVAQLMERLLRKLEHGVINGVTGERMPIPCSIGVVIERAGKTDCRKLIQEADEAMYEAKDKGKDTYYIVVK